MRPLDLNPMINFAAYCNCHSTCSGRNCVTKCGFPNRHQSLQGKALENALQQPVEGHNRQYIREEGCFHWMAANPVGPPVAGVPR